MYIYKEKRSLAFILLSLFGFVLLWADVWGIVFCWLLKKSKTIWNPIIAHIVYDVFIIVFAG